MKFGGDELEGMHIKPAENGGWAISHEVKPKPTSSRKNGISMQYQSPKLHSFGPEDGAQVMQHLAKVLNIPLKGAKE